MALRITLGSYYPGESYLHRMDPRAKVAGTLVVAFACFFVRTPVQLVASCVAAAALLASSRVPPRKVLSSMGSVVFMLAILSLFNLFTRSTGTVLATLGPLTVTTDGVWAAVLYTVRLVVALAVFALLLLTTTPSQLTDAFDAMMSPLTRLGLPGHEIAMVFSLMLRFIPTLGEETASIIDAQTSRGGSFGEGSLAHRVRATVPVIVALFASSLHHANGLARALDARCYEGGAARSHWHPLHMRAADWAALAVVLAYVAAIALLGALFPATTILL